jgi:MFS family permease
MAGTVVFALVASRVSWRWTLVAGLILAILANIGTIGRADHGTLLALRAVAGFGGGLATAVGWSVLGEGRDPSRGFGWGVAGIILFAAIGFALLPWLFSTAGFAGLLFFLAGGLAVCLPFALIVRRRPRAQASDSVAVGGGWSVSGVLSLVSFLAFSTAFTMAWTYMSLVGRDAGLGDDVVAGVFSTTQFFGIAGALCIAAVGGRFGYSGPAIAVLGAGTASIAWLLALSGDPQFFAANAIFQFAWNAGIPIILGVIAARDVGGALFRFAVPLQFVGMAVAPSVAALLIAGENYTWVVICAAGLVLLSLIALLPLMAIRPRKEAPAGS